MTFLDGMTPHVELHMTFECAYLQPLRQRNSALTQLAEAARFAPPMAMASQLQRLSSVRAPKRCPRIAQN